VPVVIRGDPAGSAALVRDGHALVRIPAVPREAGRGPGDIPRSYGAAGDGPPQGTRCRSRAAGSR
jgi:hypothetical protein